MRRVTIGALTISLSLGVAIPLSAHLVSESTGTDPVHTLTPPTEVGLSTEKLEETRRVIESMILSMILTIAGPRPMAIAAPGAAFAKINDTRRAIATPSVANVTSGAPIDTGAEPAVAVRE